MSYKYKKSECLALKKLINLTLRTIQIRVAYQERKKKKDA